MFAFFSFLILFFSPTAQAVEYYDIQIEIPNASPGSGKNVPIVVALPRDDTGVVEAQSAQTVSSSWAPMQCVLNDAKWITVRINMDGSSWPSLPSGNLATCSKTISGTQHVLRVTLVPIDWRYGDGLITSWTTGAAFTSPYGQFVDRWNALPYHVYGYKVQLPTLALLNAGGSWANTRCEVVQNDDGDYLLRQALGFEADAGNGFCRVKKCSNSTCSSTTNMDVPLALTGAGR